MSRPVVVAAFALSALCFAATARAETDGKCGPPPAVLVVQPGTDGALVPVGGIVRFFYEHGCGEVATTLVCDGNRFAETTSEDLESYDVLEHALPQSAVEGSTCELVATAADRELFRRAFTVSDDAPDALGAPSIVSGKMYIDNTDGEVVVDAAPDPLGMSKIEVRTATGVLCGAVAAPAEGGRLEIPLGCYATELEDACVEVEQIDVRGRITSAASCLEEATHGDGAAPDPDDGGCAMAPRAPRSSLAPLALVLAALAARAATRRARPSRIIGA